MKHCKGGFTLVEVTVVLIIFVVIVAITSSLLLSGTSLIAHESTVNTEKFIGDSVFNFVVSQLKYSTELKIVPAGSLNSVGNGIEVRDGKLYFSRSKGDFNNFFGDEFYYNHTIALSVVPDAADTRMLNVAVTVFSQTGEKVYTSEAAVKLVNRSAAAPVSDTSLGGAAALLYNCYDVMGASGMADKTVAELDYYAEYLYNEYERMYTEYDEQTDPEKKQLIADRISDAFHISGVIPQEADYVALVKLYCADEWPEFPPASLAPLETVQGGDGLYDRLSAETISVQPTFDVNDGFIDGACYYVASDNAGDGTAWLIYNSRDCSWYAYVKQVGAVYTGYGIAASGKTQSETLDMLESGTDQNGGVWLKLS